MQNLAASDGEVKAFKTELIDKQVLIVDKMARPAGVEVPDFFGSLLMSILYYISYTGSKWLGVRFVIIYHSGGGNICLVTS